MATVSTPPKFLVGDVVMQVSAPCYTGKVAKVHPSSLGHYYTVEFFGIRTSEEHEGSLKLIKRDPLAKVEVAVDIMDITRSICGG